MFSMTWDDKIIFYITNQFYTANTDKIVLLQITVKTTDNRLCFDRFSVIKFNCIFVQIT